MLQDYLNNLKKNKIFTLDFKVQKASHYRFKSRYPLLFSEIDYVDFHLPEGWEGIANACFGFLQEKGVKLEQVKQKMGNLIIRVKSSEKVEGVEEYIQIAFGLAQRTCEYCASSDKVSLYESGYVCRVCEDCKRVIAEANVLTFILEGNKTEFVNDYDLRLLRNGVSTTTR